ncbi:MAG TPA: hypothetical protein VF596_18465 [Pyrinomonadaceae bacterium]
MISFKAKPRKFDFTSKLGGKEVKAVAVFLIYSLELAISFALLGGLAGLGLQLHEGRWRDAIIHTVVACTCILALATVGYYAKQWLGNG